jgi:hypothetical protein
MNGKLIYKQWLKTGASKVFDVMAYDKFTLMSIREENGEVEHEIVNYLFNNYTYLMNIHEGGAWKNFMLDYKLQTYQPTSKEYIKRINAMKISTPEIKQLMEKGLQEFKQQWVKKVLEKEAEKIIFNRCKECGGLARTPYAKQCRYCGSQWHNK